MESLKVRNLMLAISTLKVRNLMLAISTLKVQVAHDVFQAWALKVY